MSPLTRAAVKLSNLDWSKAIKRLGTTALNVETMTGKGEKAGRHDEAKKRCTVPTGKGIKWKGNKVMNIGGGCTLFYNAVNGRKNEIGIVVWEELVESVLELKRVSDRLIAKKLEVKESIQNIINTYAPQFGNSMEEKNKFWPELNGLIESVSQQERIVVGADLRME